MEKREVWGEIRNMIKYVCGKKKIVCGASLGRA
jgi:hypothetical protein